MLNAPTLEQLHALKLPAMAAAWSEQQQHADLTALAFDERFALLVGSRGAHGQPGLPSAAGTPDQVLSASMDNQPLFDELLHAAERLGVAVRMEPFETPAIMGGGLCVVRGENLVLIDQRAPLLDRIRALVRALVELQSETVYMAPEARELIEAIRGNRKPHIE